MRLLADLAKADSSIAHAFRGHLYSIEDWLTSPDPDTREHWIRRVADERLLVGNAWSENNDKNVRQGDTRVERTKYGTYLLNGKKDFSTGTIYAELVDVLAFEDGVRTRVIVPTDAAGVERFDDWDGFGQRMSGTGKTTFTNVEIPSANVTRHLTGDAGEYQTAVLQMALLAVLTGIAKSTLAEVTDYLVRKTKPLFASSLGLLAKNDPYVHSDLGRISAQIFAVEAALRVAAESVEHAYRATVDGVPDRAAAAENAILSTYQAQVAIIPAVLDITTKALDDVGVTATSRAAALDRHWRNARIISSHNPVRYREAAIGHHLIFSGFPPRA